MQKQILNHLLPTSQPPKLSPQDLLLLSSRLLLGIPSHLAKSFPPKNCVCIPRLPYRVTCPPHQSTSLDLTISAVLGDLYKSESVLLLNTSSFQLTSSFLGSNFFLFALFSSSCNLRHFLKLNDHVSHPYERSVNNIVLFIVNFCVLESSRTVSGLKIMSVVVVVPVPCFYHSFPSSDVFH